MVQVRNNQLMAIQFDQSLRIYYDKISEVILKFAAGKVKPGQHRKVLQMDLSILSIEFVSRLKLRGIAHFEAASLLEYVLQLVQEESDREILKELGRCFGLLKGIEGRVFKALITKCA